MPDARPFSPCGEHRLPYREARPLIARGDVLLFRGRGLASLLIRRGGRTWWSHAAMADWWERDLFCLEVREFHGGRAVLLSSQVARFPGRIDVFRPDWPTAAQWHAERASRAMRRLCGASYGWWALLKAAALHAPGVRWFVRPAANGNGSSSAGMFCSQAVAWALRTGGLDPVPNLADRLTEPGDLGRSALLKYRFTLLNDGGGK